MTHFYRAPIERREHTEKPRWTARIFTATLVLIIAWSFMGLIWIALQLLGD